MEYFPGKNFKKSVLKFHSQNTIFNKIFQDVWGNYGDCLDDWTGQPLNCHMYPQCVPTGQHIPTGRKKRDFDFENFDV